jgi:hypothetical protein
VGVVSQLKPVAAAETLISSQPALAGAWHSCGLEASSTRLERRPAPVAPHVWVGFAPAGRASRGMSAHRLTAIQPLCVARQIVLLPSSEKCIEPSLANVMPTGRSQTSLSLPGSRGAL